MRKDRESNNTEQKMNYKMSWIAVLAAALLTGCGGAARPSMYYQLTVPGNASVAAANPYPVTLLVGPLRSSHLYRESHIVYGSNGENMGTYEYHEWSESPAEMLQDLIVRQLRGSGRYNSVDFLRSNSHGDYILYGRLYDFREVTGSQLVARFTIDLEMRNIKTGATVWTHYYSHDEPVAAKDVNAVVAALDRNAQHGITEITASLDQFFAAHPAD